jgi:hypothetical protein
VGQGAEGGRFVGSTEDSGPMKPGDSVEDKALTTRRKKKDGKVFDREPAACDGQHTSDPEPVLKPGWPKSRNWAVGSCGREAIVAALMSRYSVMVVQEETRKPEGDARICREQIPARAEVWTVNQASGFQSKGLPIAWQSLA